jgi:apolipoprotein N-acyltransferase
VLYDCAFFFPEKFCFLLVPSGVVLGIFFAKNNEIKTCVRAGFLWGGVVFAANLWWLVLVFLRHSVLSGPCAVLLYLFFVFYFAGTVIIWFILSRIIQKFFGVLGTLACTLIYFIVLDFYGLYPLGFGCGYPMANPVIPFCVLLRTDSSSDAGSELGFQISLLTPVINRENNNGAEWIHDPVAVGFRVFQQIQKICAKKNPAHEGHLILGGESFFPFDVNEHPRIINMWRSALKPGDVLLMGCCAGEFQAVLGLRKYLIIDYYVKKWLMPFAECEPPWWTRIYGRDVKKGNCALFGGALFSTFSSHGHHDISGDNAVSFVDFFSFDNITLYPSLCCEFFLFSMRSVKNNSSTLHVVFVNDSWFDRFFKERLALLARLKSWWSEKSLLYVGHEKCFLTSPLFNATFTSVPKKGL